MENKLYNNRRLFGTIPAVVEKSVESYEMLLERYPWFDTARRLTALKGQRQPNHILLANYFRPQRELFQVRIPSETEVVKNEQKIVVNDKTEDAVRTDVSSEVVYGSPHISIINQQEIDSVTDAEKRAAEALAYREQQRAKRADADEVDFPTVSGISSILGVTAEQSEVPVYDIIAAFISEEEHRTGIGKSLQEEMPPKPLPTPDNDPVLKTVMEFLSLEDYHIDTDENVPAPDRERLEGAVGWVDSGYVSEELGAIYLKQNLLDEARQIYSRLSLQNPEKSGYFATLISEAEVRAEAKKAEKTRGLKR